MQSERLNVASFGLGVFIGVVILMVVRLISELVGASRWDSKDWPAWVQAVGSVLAILVAVWLQRRDHIRDSKKRELEKLEKQSDLLSGVLAFTGTANYIASTVHDAFACGKGPGFMSPRGGFYAGHLTLTSVVNRLDAIPVEGIPAKAWQSLLYLTEDLRRLIAELEAIRVTYPQVTEYLPAVNDNVKHLCVMIEGQHIQFAKHTKEASERLYESS